MTFETDDSDETIEELDWLDDEIDLNKPNAARMYDYLLGGYHNFAIDRMMVQKTLEVFPDTALHAKVSRRILARSVRFLVEQGIDQFLDIGSGIPTVGSSHEVAHSLNPNARVVYVDIDPVVVAHSKAILKDMPHTAVLHGDVRQPERIFNDESVIRLIDFSRPVGMLMVLLLHFVTDDAEAYRCVEKYRNKLAPGSYMVLSHSTFEEAPAEIMKLFQQITSRTSTPHKYRSKVEIEAFFNGFEILEPGIVHLPLWHPESPDDPLLKEPGRSMSYVGVGRKPYAT
jgi:hypothetical protein